MCNKSVLLKTTEACRKILSENQIKMPKPIRHGDKEVNGNVDKLKKLIHFIPLENTRETREGWDLLTVETEVNGDSKSTNERSPSLVGSMGLSCRYKPFLFCLGCSGQPSTKYFFPGTLFQLLCAVAQQAGQAAVLGRLSFYYLSPENTLRYYAGKRRKIRKKYEVNKKVLKLLPRTINALEEK
jgi:hypothetical protein